jgi:predicted aspartyl protease
VIHGTVVELQAQVNITLRLSQQQSIEIECVVDTGFTGSYAETPSERLYPSGVFPL